jgi:hypothetical protein
VDTCAVLLVTACVCGHDVDEHRDGYARCHGGCYDPEFQTSYKCLCPAYLKETT